MRILFIGCVESSYILLKKLIVLRAEIVGVITKKNLASTRICGFGRPMQAIRHLISI